MSKRARLDRTPGRPVTTLVWRLEGPASLGAACPRSLFAELPYEPNAVTEMKLGTRLFRRYPVGRYRVEHRDARNWVVLSENVEVTGERREREHEPKRRGRGKSRRGAAPARARAGFAGVVDPRGVFAMQLPPMHAAWSPNPGAPFIPANAPYVDPRRGYPNAGAQPPYVHAQHMMVPPAPMLVHQLPYPGALPTYVPVRQSAESYPYAVAPSAYGTPDGRLANAPYVDPRTGARYPYDPSRAFPNPTPYLLIACADARCAFAHPHAHPQVAPDYNVPGGLVPYVPQFQVPSPVPPPPVAAPDPPVVTAKPAPEKPATKRLDPVILVAEVMLAERSARSRGRTWSAGQLEVQYQRALLGLEPLEIENPVRRELRRAPERE